MDSANHVNPPRRGEKNVATGGAMPVLRRAQPVDSGPPTEVAPEGRKNLGVLAREHIPWQTALCTGETPVSPCRRLFTTLIAFFLALLSLSHRVSAHPEGFSGLAVDIETTQVRVALTLYTRDLNNW